MKEIVLVSACLLGVPCRYDGQSKPHAGVLQALADVSVVAVCPEVLGGLPTPRPAAERLGEKVLHRDGTDVTEAFASGAAQTVALAIASGCRRAILKEKSPSCGVRRIYDGSFDKHLVVGCGVTAAQLQEAGLQLTTEDDYGQ